MSATPGKGKAIQFISEKNGIFQVTDEGLNFLNSIDSPFAVVAVCGPYRTGKSYLLNRFINLQKGFSVGPSVNPETRGMYIWNKVVPMNIPGTNEVINTLLVDTEGISSVQQNKTHDVKLFSLAMLLCDYLVYNTLGVIDDKAIEMLSLISEFSKWLSTSNEGQLDPNMFPSFTWVLRDFVLELVDEQNNPISSHQYLENCLKERYQPGQEEKNETKRALRSYFRNRDCICLVRPVSDERDLKRVDDLPGQKLRPEFLKGVEELMVTVKRKLTTKKLFHKDISGPAFAQFVTKYVQTLNSGGIPHIAETWNSVVERENTKNIEQELYSYTNYLDNYLKKQIISPDDLQVLHQQQLNQAKNNLAKKLMGDKQQVFYEILEKRVKQLFDKFDAVNRTEYEKQCTRLLGDLYATIILKPLKEKSLTQVSQLVDLWKIFSQKFSAQANSTTALATLHHFTFQYLGESFNEFFSQVKDMYQAQLKSAEDKMNKMNEKLRTLELEHTKSSMELKNGKENMTRLMAENSRIISDNAQLLEKAKQLDSQLDNMRGKYEEARSKAQQQELANERLNSEFEFKSQNQKRDLNRLEQDFARKEQNYIQQVEHFKNSIKSKDAELERERQYKAQFQNDLQQQVENFKNQNALKESEYQFLLKKEQDQKQSIINDFQNKNLELKQQLDNLKIDSQRKDNHQRDMASKLEQNNQILQNQLVDSTSKIDELNKALKTANAELHRNRQDTEKEIAKEREAKNKNESLYQAYQKTQKQQLEALEKETKDKDRQLNELTSQLKSAAKEFAQEREARLKSEALHQNYLLTQKQQLEFTTSEYQRESKEKDRYLADLNNQVKNLSHQLNQEREALQKSENLVNTQNQQMEYFSSNYTREQAETAKTISELNSHITSLTNQLVQERDAKQKSDSLFQNFQSTQKQQLDYVKAQHQREVKEKEWQLNELNTQLTQERDTKENFSKDLSSTKSSLRSYQENHQQEIDHLMGEVLREKKEKEKLKAQLDKITKELASDRKEKTQLDSLISTQGQMKQELVDKANKLDQETKEKDRIISELETNLRQQKINMNSLNNQNSNLTKELRQKDNIINEQNSLLEPLRKELRHLQEKELSMVDNSEIIKLQSELEFERKDKENISNELKRKEQRLTRLANELTEKESELSELNSSKKETRTSKKKKRESDSEDEKKRPKKKTQKKDPEKMTIKEIKSELTHAGYDYVLPTETRSKPEYVALYKKYMKE